MGYRRKKRGSYGKVVEIERNEFGLSMKSALKIISIPGNNSELRAVMGEGIDNKSITSYFYGFVEEIIKEIAIMSELKGHTNIVTYEDHRVIPHEDHIGWDILIRMELLTSLLDYSEEHEITEQTVTNEIEEIQEVRKKVDDMRVKFEKIKEKIENNWSGENKDSYIRKIDIIYESLQPIPKELDDLVKSLKSTAESEYKKDLAKEEKQ